MHNTKRSCGIMKTLLIETFYEYRTNNRRSVFSRNIKEDDRTSFSSSFSQNQRWTKWAILWEVSSDWLAVLRNSSRNSARTCWNTRNDVYSQLLTFRENIDCLARTAKCEMRKMIGEMVYKMPSTYRSLISPTFFRVLVNLTISV